MCSELCQSIFLFHHSRISQLLSKKENQQQQQQQEAPMHLNTNISHQSLLANTNQHSLSVEKVSLQIYDRFDITTKYFKYVLFTASIQYSNNDGDDSNKELMVYCKELLMPINEEVVDTVPATVATTDIMYCARISLCDVLFECTHNHGDAKKANSSNYNQSNDRSYRTDSSSSGYSKITNHRVSFYVRKNQKSQCDDDSDDHAKSVVCGDIGSTEVSIVMALEVSSTSNNNSDTNNSDAEVSIVRLLLRDIIFTPINAIVVAAASANTISLSTLENVTLRSYKLPSFAGNGESVTSLTVESDRGIAIVSCDGSGNSDNTGRIVVLDMEAVDDDDETLDLSEDDDTSTASDS